MHCKTLDSNQTISQRCCMHKMLKIESYEERGLVKVLVTKKKNIYFGHMPNTKSGERKKVGSNFYQRFCVNVHYSQD